MVKEFENYANVSIKDSSTQSAPYFSPPNSSAQSKRCHGIWEKEKDNNPIERNCHYRDTHNFFLNSLNDNCKEKEINFLEQRRLMELKRTDAKIEEMKKKDEGLI